MRRSSSTLRPAASCGCAEPTAGSSWPARSDTATSSERFRPDLVHGAGARIKDAVTSWAGVEAFPHRFGGTEYRLGRKEMGHVHGDRLGQLLDDDAQGRGRRDRAVPDAVRALYDSGGIKSRTLNRRAWFGCPTPISDSLPQLASGDFWRRAPTARVAETGMDRKRLPPAPLPLRRLRPPGLAAQPRSV